MRMTYAPRRYFICSFMLLSCTAYAITTYYTPNMYAYNLSFSGNQSNYAAALAIVMAVITMAIAYIVQLNSLKEQMK